MADQEEKLKDEAEGFNCWVSFLDCLDGARCGSVNINPQLLKQNAIFPAMRGLRSCFLHVHLCFSRKHLHAEKNDKLQREQLNSQLWRHNAPLWFQEQAIIQAQSNSLKVSLRCE